MKSKKSGGYSPKYGEGFPSFGGPLSYTTLSVSFSSVLGIIHEVVLLDLYLKSRATAK
jgi:hypothetical protein